MGASVLVVGDALLDVLAAPSEPMRPGADVPAAVRVAPGGQGANLAVRLARRGVAVELVCAIAEDAAGRLLRESLAADGVRVHPRQAVATGTVIVLVDAAGERTMLSQRVPLAGRLGDAPSATADWLVVSGYLFLEPGAASAARCHSSIDPSGTAQPTSIRRGASPCTAVATRSAPASRSR